MSFYRYLFSVLYHVIGSNLIKIERKLTGTITILDTDTDQLVAMLPCDPGCHGVQFGAKQDGGYYAYVSSKFSNELLVVDADPDNDGDASDALIAGRISLVSLPTTAIDDTIVGSNGMGGQGVLAIPIPYNGWVQNLPDVWKDQLTSEQQNPIQQSFFFFYKIQNLRIFVESQIK